MKGLESAELSSGLTSKSSRLQKVVSYFKKYKALMLSIVIFIVLDLSILIFNFYISYKIENDAAVINIAARQGMLSQRITKNLLEFERAYNKSIPYGSILNDIHESIQLFDETLNVFDLGGFLEVEDGSLLQVSAITEPAGRASIDTSKPMWAIYKNYTNDILNEFDRNNNEEESLTTIFSREYIIKSVVVYAMFNNISLLDVTEDLTYSIKTVAEKKTQQLRMIQFFGIVLAVLNFFYIMLYSLKNIQRKDESLFDAKNEVTAMLNAISEGVVLIDKEFVMREHYSTEMEKIFNRTDFEGKSFVGLMESSGCEDDVSQLKPYLKYWFDIGNGNAELISQNPISETRISNTLNTGFQFSKKYLNVSFSRIYNVQGSVVFLLVRIKDITEGVEQAIALTDERAIKQNQLSLMSSVVNNDVDELPGFFQCSYARFEKMNELLLIIKQSKNNKAFVQDLLSLVGEFGEQAQGYHFSSLVKGSDAFEAKVRRLDYDKPKISELTALLDQLIANVKSIHAFVTQVASERWAKAVQTDQSVQADWTLFEDFAQFLAKIEGKDVELTISGFEGVSMAKELVEVVQSILLQIIHHSVCASIESPENRLTLSKPAVGAINVELVSDKFKNIDLTIKNDGKGFDSKAMPTDKVASNTSAGLDKASNTGLLAIALSSYIPREYDPFLLKDGRLLLGKDIIERLDQFNSTVTIQNQAYQGTSFQFSFPQAVELGIHSIREELA